MTEHKSKTILSLEKRLEPFLSRNTYSKIGTKGKRYMVINPWNDSSIKIPIKLSNNELIDTLNDLILPPRFTAIYHVDSNIMEYMFTLLPAKSSLMSRKFVFNLDGKQYLCYFKESTKPLLLLSDVFERGDEITATEYRNLLDFRFYTHKLLPDKDTEHIKPVSFFVEGFKEYNEEFIVNVCKNLNFYMNYYSRNTPYIVIHSTETKEDDLNAPIDFIEGAFPNMIQAKSKNPLLLDFASAAIGKEIRLQYLYYYQIIEYAAFYFTSPEIKKNLNRILKAPDLLSNMEKYISKILDITENIGADDTEKIRRTVLDACQPDVIWAEIQNNKRYFSKEQTFDGGFTIEILISENTSQEEFTKICYSKVPDKLRVIRNALAHAREKNFDKIISPTEHNNMLLSPWRDIVHRVAEQVLIYNQ